MPVNYERNKLKATQMFELSKLVEENVPALAPSKASAVQIAQLAEQQLGFRVTRFNVFASCKVAKVALPLQAPSGNILRRIARLEKLLKLACAELKIDYAQILPPDEKC